MLNMNSIKFWGLLLMFAFSREVIAGPFGLSQGMPLSSLKVVRKLSDGMYSITVPNPNSGFEIYTAVLTPQDGLCKIVALGKDFDNDRYGSSAREKYAELKEFLDQKYGEGQTFDFIKNGALWDSSDEWVMSIKQNERTYVTFYITDKLPQKLPDYLKGIKLEVDALSSSTSYVRLGYEFANIDTCLKRIKSSDNESL